MSVRSLKETVVGIYIEKNGVYEYTGESHTVEELGGTIPAVGDLIVELGVPSGANRANPANRTLQEVVARYFHPQMDERIGARVALVVKDRPGTPKELVLLADS